MEEKSVGDQLEGAFDGEDGGEEVVPVSQSLRMAQNSERLDIHPFNSLKTLSIKACIYRSI